MQRLVRIVGLVVLVLVGALLVLNLPSLDDGVRYLTDRVQYDTSAVSPLGPDGLFGHCYTLVSLRNAQRAAFIEDYIMRQGLDVKRLPIEGSALPNLFVPFTAGGPYLVFSAHYDKVYDDPDYHGASDNSAAVCVLMVAAARLKQAHLPRPVAVLFTGAEEVGLLGAQSFYAYAAAHDLQVAEVINLDSIGRGGLAVRPSTERAGFYFSLPFIGNYVYDGRELALGTPLLPLDYALIERLQRVAPITVYDRMGARSDGSYWEAQGWAAVNLSSDNMYYLDQTWHTYADRIELLDETSMHRTLEFILEYAATAAPR